MYRAFSSLRGNHKSRTLGRILISVGKRLDDLGKLFDGRFSFAGSAFVQSLAEVIADSSEPAGGSLVNQITVQLTGVGKDLASSVMPSSER